MNPPRKMQKYINLSSNKLIEIMVSNNYYCKASISLEYIIFIKIKEYAIRCNNRKTFYYITKKKSFYFNEHILSSLIFWKVIFIIDINTCIIKFINIVITLAINKEKKCCQIMTNVNGNSSMSLKYNPLCSEQKECEILSYQVNAWDVLFCHKMWKQSSLWDYCISKSQLYILESNIYYG